MNILIGALSKINSNLTPETFKSITYRSDIGEIEGRQTNEAPTKYLTHKALSESGELFEKIIILVTDECLDEKINAVNGKTTYE